MKGKKIVHKEQTTGNKCMYIRKQNVKLNLKIMSNNL